MNAGFYHTEVDPGLWPDADGGADRLHHVSVCGDPIDGMLPESATQLERDQLREELGLNDGVLTQYGRFVGNIAQGISAFPITTRWMCSI
ncbi:hypothetical protein MBH78_01100 [Oceanimonas sp. NS1]|nr:hypothetical protein [Oceanimonas sp. NS1]